MQILDYQSTQTPRPKRAIGWIETSLHVVFGVLLPLFCLAITCLGRLNPGGLGKSMGSRAVAELLISGPSVWAFYPWLGLSMASLIAVLVDAPRASRSVLVRIGLYGGVILAGQFFLSVATTEFVFGAIAPGITLVSYLRASSKARQLSQDQREPLWRWISWWSAWLAGYMVAWDLAVRSVLREYAQLPDRPPGCYIATASSRGHRWLVSAEQLRHLKAAELALRQIAPSLHASLRRAYDRIGRAIAKQIDNAIVADVAYLSLKPIEWIIVAMMHLLLPRSLRAARSLLVTPLRT